MAGDESSDSPDMHVEDSIPVEKAREAASHLGNGVPGGSDRIDGDTALLAVALRVDDSVVVADDKPLRKACKAKAERLIDEAAED